MISFNQVIIDTSALAHNYRYLSGKVGEGVKFMAMVKSDAYGHSMIESAQVFEQNGCTSFGVAELSEGVELRESGCNGDILVFVGFDYRDSEYLLSHNLTPVIFNHEDLSHISETAARFGKKLPIYLKFDCGMSRLGFYSADAPEIFKKCESQQIDVTGIISHFPCSDDRSSNHSEQAYQLFSSITQTQGIQATLEQSICNSGGILYFPETHADLVRAGISLYGYYPDGAEGRTADFENGLLPAMKCCTRVIQVKQIEAGRGVSYGHTFVAERETQLAILPIGYSDGYFRSLSNLGEVLIRGRRAPIRGRICMNMCMVDITDIAGVEVGDEVILLGTQGEERIDADDIANLVDTISYEVLCSLGNNNKRYMK